jgi:predicted transcriptional regulator
MDLMLRIFKALANQTRIKAMKLLLSKGELGIEEIAAILKIPEATACRNLKTLERVSLVKSRIYRGRTYYRIDNSLALVYNPLILEILKKPRK